MFQIKEKTQVVFMTRDDFENLLQEQVQAMVAAKTAVTPSDISIKGETIKPLLVNGVKYVTRADTARLLGKSYPTLFRWNRSGRLKAIKLGEQSVYYRYDDIVRMLDGSAASAFATERGGES